MKKLWLIILLSLMACLILPIIKPVDAIPTSVVKDSITQTSPTNHYSAFGSTEAFEHHMLQEFTTSSTYILNRLCLTADRDPQCNTGVLIARLFNCVDSQPNGDEITSCSTSNTNIAIGNDDNPTKIYIGIASGVVLYSGHDYCWVFSDTYFEGAGLNYRINLYDKNGTSSTPKMLQSFADDVPPFTDWVLPTSQYQFQILFDNWGYSETPGITTEPLMKDYQTKGWDLFFSVGTLGLDTSVTVTFNYGQDANMGYETTNSFEITKSNMGDEFIQFKDEYEFPVIYYQAKMTGDQTGIVNLGDVLNSDMTPGVDNSACKIATVTPEATQRTPDSAKIGVILYKLGLETSITEKLIIGKSVAEMLASIPKTLKSNVTVPHSVTYYQVTGLATGTEYFAEAYAEGSLSGSPYKGNVISFTTPGGNGSGKVKNIGDDFFNKIGLGQAGYWIMMLLLMAVIWIWKTARDRPVIGIVFDVIILGIFITLFLDKIIVVILGICAVAICLGIVGLRRAKA